VEIANGTYLVFGSFISMLLIVNAFFIKELVKNISEIKIDVIKLLTNHDNSSSDIDDNKEDIKDLYKTINTLRDRINRIEGEMNHQSQ